jgi:hypothetical protein
MATPNAVISAVVFARKAAAWLEVSPESKIA